MVGSKYSNYLKKLDKYWQDNGPKIRETEGNILVDLIHDNVKYLFLNLNLAKYIQCNIGGELHGITGDWPTVFNDYNSRLCLDLSAAFGLKDLLNVNSVKLDVEDLNRSLKTRLLKTIDEQRLSLAKLLFTDNDQIEKEFSSEEIELLQVNYDFTLRDNLLPTITEKDLDTFFECLSKSIRFKITAEKLAAVKNIRVAVLGHIEYPQYYFFAKAVLSRGGKVYFHWPLVFGTIKVLESLDCLKSAKNSKFIDHYKSEYLAFLEENKQDVETFSHALAENLSVSRGYDREKSSLTDLNRKSFLRSCGITSAFDNTIVLFSHANSDAVHSNGAMLFGDFSEWLEESVEFFTQHEVNVLVKVHPKHLTYDITDFISLMREKFKGVGNFGIVSHHINNSVLAEYADCFVTVNGSPGLEMAAVGASVVLAGESRYSGLGIAFEPTSPNEYFDIVLNVALQKLSLGESKQNALNFLYFESVYSVVRSFSVPDMITFDPNCNIWEQLSQQIGFKRHEYDELYFALCDQLRHGAVQLNSLQYLKNYYG